MLAALLLALPLIVPFLQSGLPNTADAEIHLHRIISAAVNMDAGYFYPRWTPYLHHGFGYPIHNFYAPGLHIIGAILYLLTPLDGVTIFKLLQLFFTLLYPLGAYRFARTFTGRTGALVAAAVYTYAPFRFDELWLQTNLSQFCAMALLPFLFSSLAHSIQTPQKRSVAIIAFFFGAITLLHHPTGFLTAPFAGLYALWMALFGIQHNNPHTNPSPLHSPHPVGREFVTEQQVPFPMVWRGDLGVRLSFASLRLKILFIPIMGLLLGMGLSAIFWLPALAEFRYVQISSIQRGTFNAASNLIALNDLLRPILPIDRNLQNPQRFFSPGLVQIIMASIGFLATIIFRRKLSVWAFQNVVIGTLFALLALFLMTPTSAWLWENLPIANFVVYPWRLLGVLALAVIPAIAVLPDFFPVRWRNGIAGGLLGIVFMTALPMLYAPLNFYIPGDLVPGEAFVYEKRTGNLGLTSGNEYLPIWAKERPIGGSPMEHQLFEWRVDLYEESLPENAVFARVTQECAKTLTCYQLETPQAFKLLFNQMYYPGWHITLDNAPIEVTPEGVHGLIGLEMPAGKHTLTIQYAGTTIQHIGTLISLISIFISLGLVLSQKRIPQTATQADNPTHKLAFSISACVLIFVMLNQIYLSPATDFMRPAGNPDEPPSQNHVDIPFGDSLALTGFDISAISAAPGETMSVRLYWHLRQATPISPRASVQITDITGTTVWAQMDSASIAGQNFANWQPGKYAIDTYQLTLAPDTPPFVGQLRVAIYTQNPDITYIPAENGENFVTLSPIRITGDYQIAPDDTLQRVNVAFGDTIILRGVKQIDHEDEYCVWLRWQAQKDALPEYAILLHTFDSDQNFIAGFDAAPFDNRYPTSAWAAGQTLDDEHCFELPDNAAEIAIGLYTRADVVRLSASGSDNLRDNTFILPISRSTP